MPLGQWADSFREMHGRFARFPGAKQLQLSEQISTWYTPAIELKQIQLPSETRSSVSLVFYIPGSTAGCINTLGYDTVGIPVYVEFYFRFSKVRTSGNGWHTVVLTADRVP